MVTSGYIENEEDIKSSSFLCVAGLVSKPDCKIMSLACALHYPARKGDYTGYLLHGQTIWYTLEAKSGISNSLESMVSQGSSAG